MTPSSLASEGGGFNGVIGVYLTLWAFYSLLNVVIHLLVST